MKENSPCTSDLNIRVLLFGSGSSLSWFETERKHGAILVSLRKRKLSGGSFFTQGVTLSFFFKYKKY